MQVPVGGTTSLDHLKGLSDWDPTTQDLYVFPDQKLTKITLSEKRLASDENVQKVAKIVAESLEYLYKEAQKYREALLDRSATPHFNETREQIERLQVINKVWNGCKEKVKELAKFVEQRENELSTWAKTFSPPSGYKNLSEAIEKIENDSEFPASLKYDAHVTSQMDIIMEIKIKAHDRLAPERRIYQVYGKSTTGDVANDVLFFILHPSQLGPVQDSSEIRNRTVENRKTTINGATLDLFERMQPRTIGSLIDRQSYPYSKAIVGQVLSEIDPHWFTFPSRYKMDEFQEAYRNFPVIRRPNPYLAT